MSEAKVNVTMEQLEQFGMNLLGQFIQVECKHDMVTDLVDMKIVFNSTVYGLQASYEDLRTEAGAANAFGQLITRLMINTARGEKMVQLNDAKIEEIMNGAKE